MFPRRPDTGETKSPAGFSGGSVLVIAEGDNPSLAYFVQPRLEEMASEVILADSRKPPANLPAGIDAAVVVRYLPSAWHDVLWQLRAAGCPVVYFMDDDLMDSKSQSGLPLRYRWKIARRALWQRSAIESLCSEFWVSTPWLAAKYAAWSPHVLVARANAQTCPQAGTRHDMRDASTVQVSYHGTASHIAEQRWLRPLVSELQASSAHTHFTIVGDSSVLRLYRGIPRVTVVQPMAWPEYLAWTIRQGCDIALAPLLPGPFNAARAATKYLDFARMGAAGIYADVTPYHERVQHSVDGLLLAMQKDEWLLAILMLAADPARRTAMAAEARRRVLAQVLR